jgi:DNA helicase-2/ATP-dependent DNA helicase PcrA
MMLLIMHANTIQEPLKSALIFPVVGHGLTQEQSAAACHIQGHARVLAVAGAGKTKMLIARIAYLLDEAVSAKRIRVLTYNREAAEDFRRRMQRELGSTDVVVQTFHALGWKLLQRLMQQKYLPSWSLASAGQETFLKREALRLTKIDQDQMETLGQAIEWAKGQAAPLDLTLSVLPGGLSVVAPAVKQLEALRERAKVWFFTDMLYAPWQLLATHPDLRAEFANHLDHILVDEYQDVNEVQHTLLHWLAGDRAQVMVVGDVDQCIYTWRGANPDFLGQRFEQDFKGAITHYLPHSFRFGHALALLANHAIAANDWADRRAVLATTSSKPTQVEVLVGSQAPLLVRSLTIWHEQVNNWHSSAVLVRVWAQAASVELALLQANIPYRLLGEKSVWDAPMTQGVMALLALAEGRLWQWNSEDRLSALTAFWQLPPLGMPKAARERLTQISAQSPDQVFAAIEAMPCERDWLKAYWLKRANVWHDLVSGNYREWSALALVREFISQTDAQNRLEKLSGSPQQGDMHVGVLFALRDVLSEQQTLTQAIEQFAAMRESSLFGQAQDDAVTLTTIHRVKGREWDAVWVAGLQEGAFPSSRSDEQPLLLEEERRLFYVAITRARRQLILLVPDLSVLIPLWEKGLTANSAGQSSRFMAETNLTLCQQLGAFLHGTEKKLPTAGEVRIANDYLSALGRKERVRPVLVKSVGHNVRHDKFGSGMVMSRRDDKIEVMFGDGVRWLKADHPALSWD